MPQVNNIIINFAAGELSPRLRGHNDLKIYYTGLELCQNFIVETQGPSRFREGSVYVNHTRSNNVAAIYSFQFNDIQSYMLEFTNKYIRFFKDGGVVLDTSKTITGITAADPGVVTSASHGYEDGDEVYIASVVGMTDVNGSYYIVANKTANTFELTDVDGTDIDTSGYTAYTSGGTVSKIYEVASPYLERHLFELKIAQNADTMYIVHPYYEPRKLTRSGDASWTLARFTRTADPFLDEKVITGITAANPGVVTSTDHGYSDGDIVIIEEVVGMTELNGGIFTVANKDANTFELTDIDGGDVDTSGYTAYGSAGIISNQNFLPGAISFYESRLLYGRSDLYPEKFWGSRGPDTSGVPRFDDFTTGADDDHAVIFTLAPVNGKVDSIQWLAGNTKYLAMGTYGGVTKATGSGTDEPITPGSIKTSPVDSHGCANIMPIPYGNIILYAQLGGLVIRSLEYSVIDDGYAAIDRVLVADHITKSGVKQLAFSNGRPDVLWAVRNDGVLIGLTFKAKEDVSGWHRHILGGTDSKVLSVGVTPQTLKYDRIWLVVERTVNSLTRRSIGYIADEVTFPEKEEYYTDQTTETVDTTKFLNAMFEKQKEYVHLDSSLSYNGADYTSGVGATITPAALSGTGIQITSDVDVFTSGSIGNQIWKKLTNSADKGIAVTGRYEITHYTDAKNVSGTALKAFDSLTAMAPGEWYLTASAISGLEHLEGETVKVITDGSVHPDETVTGGAIALDYEASTVHIGLKYTGIMKSMLLEIGGVNGPSITKVKNIDKVYFKFLHTLGAQYGLGLYDMAQLVFRSTASIGSRPQPLFSSIKSVDYPDKWEREKYIYILQEYALPCIVQFMDIYGEVVDVSEQ